MNLQSSILILCNETMSVALVGLSGPCNKKRVKIAVKCLRSNFWRKYTTRMEASGGRIKFV